MDFDVWIVDGFAHDVGVFSYETGAQRVCRGTSGIRGQMLLAQTIYTATYYLEQ